MDVDVGNVTEEDEDEKIATAEDIIVEDHPTTSVHLISTMDNDHNRRAVQHR